MSGSDRASAAPPRPPEAIQLKTQDGLVIAGFWLAGDPGAPAVLLLHDAGRDHNGYKPLWERLRYLGVSVLAIDFRGHGVSQRTTQDAYERMVAGDGTVFRSLVQDAEAGLRFLTSVQSIPESRIAVVGAEIGASVGFDLMARHPKLFCMATLSPASLSHGLQVDPLLDRYGKRPLLIVSSKKLLGTGPQAIHDRLAKTASVRLEVFAGDPVRGTEFFGQRIDVEGLVTAWLQGTLLQKR
jgi:alpha-beta hydrolase superfamily lysophospholipase